jgi:hypothetical protein
MQVRVWSSRQGVVAKVFSGLGSLGYNICGWASSGEEAWRSRGLGLTGTDGHRSEEVDGRSGEYIRTNFGIPVVYLTAYADEHTLQRAKVTNPSAIS